MLGAMLLSNSSVFAQGTVVFDSIPAPVPPNVPSQGFECCSVAEVGDEVKLEADTPRRAGYVTVLMSSWALHSSYPLMPAEGFMVPVTLNIYADEASARAQLPLKSVTQNVLMSWRPEADASCGTAWKASDGNCYNGYAFKIVLDLRSADFNLPDQFVYGIAYNTNSWGYAPIHQSGPYDSLNVGTSNVGGVGVAPSVGTDVQADVVYVNYSYGPFYADGGASGIGVFRPDTLWSGYEPAVEFSTLGMPTSTNDCKNGAWQNLMRADLSPFKNQGACVSYVNTGK